MCDAVPVLSLLIRRGELEAVLACLESPTSIDFTRTTSPAAINPIHEIVFPNAAGWPEYNRKVLRAVVHRIARNPRDIVDWSMKCVGFISRTSCDFISLAAENQLLSVVWPEVCSDVSYYADQTEPIQLTAGAWALDWERLGPQEQQLFHKPFVLLPGDERMSKLAIACQRFPEPDFDAIRDGVLDPTAPSLLTGDIPVLAHFMRHGPMTVVKALLETQFPLNFSFKTTIRGITPLHVITWGWYAPGAPRKTAEDVADLLKLLLDHMDRQPEDKIDWGIRDHEGHDAISRAAAYGHLCTFVQVLVYERAVPYFTEYKGKMPITRPAQRPDVHRLQPEDAERFDFTAGFQE
eukprot:gene7909-biopygen4843